MSTESSRTPDQHNDKPPLYMAETACDDVAASPPAPSFKNVTAPGYELLAELGRGGMGVVYKARHVQLNRVVALKMILAGSHAAASEVKRFLSEAEAVAAFSHPNIVQVYEFGKHGDLPYMALEFIDGENLAQKLARGALPPKEAARLVEQMAHGMNAAHQAGIVHRDLKPANVLLGEDGVPKITDFGLAKRVQGESGLTRTGAIMGTPSYMAPEQAEGESKRIGPAVDVYALGAVLYECLIGRPPFQADNVMNTLLQVMGEEPSPPRRLDQTVPADLETICLKCLEKNPHKRYDSAHALAEDLRRWRQGEPITSRPVGRLERSWKWVKRRPAEAALIGLGVVAVLLLVIGGWAFTVHLGQQRDEAMRLKERALQGERDARNAQKFAEQQQQLAQARATAEADAKHRFQVQLGRAEAAHYAMQLTLAQREWESFNIGKALRVLDDCQPKQRGWEYRYLRHLCQRRLTPVASHTSSVHAVAISPQGKLFATGGSDGTIILHQLPAVTRRRAWTAHKGPVTSLDFSKTAGRLVSSSLDGTIKIWDLDKRQAILTLTEHTSGVTSAAFVANGTKLISSSRDNTVMIWRTDTGKRLATLQGHNHWVLDVTMQADGQRLASGSQNRDIIVWDAATGKAVHTFRDNKGHAGDVTCVSFAPVGPLLASGSNDRTIKIWDTKSNRLVQTLTGHTNIVTDVAFLRVGHHLQLVSSSADRTIRVWDPITGRSLRILRGSQYPIHAVSVSLEGGRIVSGGGRVDDQQAEVLLWNLSENPQSLKLNGHGWHISSVTVRHDGKQFASGSWDATIKVWTLPECREQFTLQGHDLEINRVRFSPNGQLLASGSVDKTVKIWNLKKRAEAYTLQGHKGAVTDVAFLGAGYQLISGSADQTLKMWDTATGKLLRTLHGHGDAIQCLAVDPQHKHFVASGDAKGAIFLWENGNKRGFLQGTAKRIYALSFRPDMQHLASADTEITIWDLTSHKEIMKLTGHRRPVTHIEFSRDGRRLFSSSEDGTVKIWDVATGQELMSLEGHGKTVREICLSPAEDFLLSCSDDETIRVWRTSP